MSEKVILSINKLSFGYTKEKEVLKNVNLDLNEGEILGILGASGIGKSSLLRIIVGLEYPKTGEVSYQGKPLNNNDYFVMHSNDVGFSDYVQKDYRPDLYNGKGGTLTWVDNNS